MWHPMTGIQTWLSAHQRRARRGATAPLVAFSMVGLLGMTAAALDGGMLYVEQRRLQNIADAAALAGARELPGSVIAALTLAQDYVENNGATAADIEEIAVEAVYHPLDSVRIVLSRDLPLSFAPILGQTTQTVRARSVALTAQVEPKYLWPWGITQDSIRPGNVQLKLGAGGSSTGNFHALSLPNGRGASTYESNIRNGFSGSVPANVPPDSWWLDTETGNMAGPTDDGASDLLDQPACTLPGMDVRCPRVGLVPVLRTNSWESVNGRDPVEVIGFAVMELVGMTNGSRGHRDVIARFETYARADGRPTKLGAPLEGLLGVRLWQ